MQCVVKCCCVVYVCCVCVMCCVYVLYGHCGGVLSLCNVVCCFVGYKLM